ncbi:MAG TPA: SsrA-binding protein [Myxococcales bacterium]|nr:SsrA-binding protein [Deltaproteobacteria bacterium]HAA54065.1 SsrA-binding protein [Myxococcales bacterium]|tara:strand:- start:5214 stop:5708 length:495 start_codon:yes stop_codon:yes gene_type:complete
MAKNSKKSKSKGWDGDRKIIAVNRRARHDYTVEDTLETGIALLGTEVKSLREGKLSFKDSYAAIEDGELWLLNAHIDEYGPANRFNHEPERRRKLLAQKRQIEKLWGQTRQDGYTLIPLRFYFKGSWVKVEIGICVGKKKHDQRQDIAKREAKRQIARALKNNY